MEHHIITVPGNILKNPDFVGIKQVNKTQTLCERNRKETLDIITYVSAGGDRKRDDGGGGGVVSTLLHFYESKCPLCYAKYYHVVKDRGLIAPPHSGTHNEKHIELYLPSACHPMHLVYYPVAIWSIYYI